MPFTPSSPLLSCSQEGSRHTVMSYPLCPRDGLSEMCAQGAVWVWECVPYLPPCTVQSKLSRHGSGADSDYENTPSGDPLLG